MAEWQREQKIQWKEGKDRKIFLQKLHLLWLHKVTINQTEMSFPLQPERSRSSQHIQINITQNSTFGTEVWRHGRSLPVQRTLCLDPLCPWRQTLARPVRSAPAFAAFEKISTEAPVRSLQPAGVKVPMNRSLPCLFLASYTVRQNQSSVKHNSSSCNWDARPVPSELLKQWTPPVPKHDQLPL